MRTRRPKAAQLSAAGQGDEMKGIFDHEGGGQGPPLNGVESRALRGLLCLERRHIVLLANMLGVGPRRGVDNVVVFQWERSAGRGYPEALVELMQGLDAAVGSLGQRFAREARETAVPGPDGDTATIMRPLGAKRIVQIIGLGHQGLAISPSDMELLDAQGGDFWHCLCDAAIARAALILDEDDLAIRVVLDRAPSEDDQPREDISLNVGSKI